MKIKEIFQKEWKLLAGGIVFLALGLSLLLLPPVKIGGLTISSPLLPTVAGASSYDLTYKVSQWLDVGNWGSANGRGRISIGPAQWQIQGTMGGKTIRETWDLVKVQSSIELYSDYNAAKNGQGSFTEISLESSPVISDPDQNVDLMTTPHYYYRGVLATPDRIKGLYIFKDLGFKKFSCGDYITPYGSYGWALASGYEICDYNRENYNFDSTFAAGTFHPSEWRITGTIE